MSFAPLTLTLARREGFAGDAELQEELNKIQQRLHVVEKQLARALHQTALMSMIPVFPVLISLPYVEMVLHCLAEHDRIAVLELHIVRSSLYNSQKDTIHEVQFIIAKVLCHARHRR